MDEDKVLKKLVEQDSKFDRIINKLVDHDALFDTLATKQSLEHLEERVTKALDDQLVILQRLDQERVFTTEWIRRIEADVETIKVRLNLAGSHA